MMQGVDRRIQVAMLLLQAGKFSFKFALIFVGHGHFDLSAIIVGPDAYQANGRERFRC